MEWVRCTNRNYLSFKAVKKKKGGKYTAFERGNGGGWKENNICMPSLMHCGILELLYKIGWLPEFTNMVTEKLSSLLRVTCSVHVGTLIMTQNPMFFSII